MCILDWNRISMCCGIEKQRQDNYVKTINIILL